MPAKVIATVHQLAAACKKYKGIVFTDKDANVINDNNDNDYTLEITGVDTNNTNNDMNNNTQNNNTLEITGVAEDNTSEDNTFQADNTLEITGVAKENIEETETATETGVWNNEHNIAQNMNSEQNDAGHNQDTNYHQYDDDISIKDEIPEDIQVTINDMNTIQEMNAGQLNIYPVTGEAIEEEIEMSTHGYNLRPRPTKRNQR